MRAVGAGLLSGLLLTGCVDSSRPHAPAPAGYALLVKAGTPVPGRARIVAFKGQVLTRDDAGAPIDPASGDLLVNGIDVGGVNRGQAIAIDLLPAIYRVSWRDLGDTGAAAPALSIPLMAGQIVYVSMDRQMPVRSGHLPLGGLVAPLAGSALESAGTADPSGPLMRLRADGSALIQPMEIVGTTQRP